MFRRRHRMFFDGVFRQNYKAFSVSMLPGPERENVERGGKIIMPPSALELLTELNITYPMLFKLSNQETQRTTHCGVLEFIADAGRVYLPHWMMKNLSLSEGSVVRMESVTLPVATFSRFQPQTSDFLDISNPKAVLENTLRLFACLTAGDLINIRYNNKNYELCVLDTEPGNAVSIIECDMNVDFAPPVDYVEPVPVPHVEAEEEEEVVEEASGFFAFGGEGHRLDSKQKKPQDENEKPTRAPGPVGIPDYQWTVGSLSFMRNVRRISPEKKDEEVSFKPFSGSGNSMM